MNLRKKTLVLSLGLLFSLFSAVNIWALKITGLQSSDGRKHELVEDGMDAGDLLCTDRAYTITGVPDRFSDVVWIRTANDSKTTAGKRHI